MKNLVSKECERSFLAIEFGFIALLRIGVYIKTRLQTVARATVMTSALLLVVQISYAEVISNGCADPSFCTLSELFDGGSIQVDTILMTDWTLGDNEFVDLDNVAIGQGYVADEAGVLSKNRELRVPGVGSIRFSYSFKATSLREPIIGMAGELGYRWVVGPTALIEGGLDVGQTQGSYDLGSTTDVFSLSQNPGPGRIVIDVPRLTDIWVNNEISLSSAFYDNSAEIGFLSNLGEGAGFRNAFILAPLLDADSDGTTDALTDGVLIIRYLFGFHGAILCEGATASEATRTDDEIEAYIGEIQQELDVDGNGVYDALTDGLLIIRSLFGFHGVVLCEGATASEATRTCEEIEAYIADRTL